MRASLPQANQHTRVSVFAPGPAPHLRRRKLLPQQLDLSHQLSLVAAVSSAGAGAACSGALAAGRARGGARLARCCAVDSASRSWRICGGAGVGPRGRAGDGVPSAWAGRQSGQAGRCAPDVLPGQTQPQVAPPCQHPHPTHLLLQALQLLRGIDLRRLSRLDRPLRPAARPAELALGLGQLTAGALELHTRCRGVNAWGAGG